MAKAGRKANGQFAKRSGGGSRKRRSSSGGGTALVIRENISVQKRPATKTRYVTQKKKGGHRRRHHGGGGVTIAKVVGAGLLLGSAAETNNGPLGPTVYNMVQKLPGVKTFGGAVTAGLYIGALGKYTRLGRGRAGAWMRAAGIIGLAGAALKIGAQGTKFQWLGADAPDPYMHVR